MNIKHEAATIFKIDVEHETKNASKMFSSLLIFKLIMKAMTDKQLTEFSFSINNNLLLEWYTENKFIYVISTVL